MSTAAPTTSRPPDLTELWRTYFGTRSVADRNRLVEQYLPLLEVRVGLLAARLPRVVDPGDLRQWGSIGLMKAVEAFDPARGVQFRSFAGLRITGAMIDGLRDTALYTRRRREMSKLLADAEQAHYHETGRAAARDDVAERLNVNGRTFDRMYKTRTPAQVSLSNLIAHGESREVSWEQATAGPDVDLGRPLADSELVRFVFRHMLESDQFRLTDVLSLHCRFMLGMTTAAVGEVVGLSEARIGQVLKGLLPVLRVRLRDAA